MTESRFGALLPHSRLVAGLTHEELADSTALIAAARPHRGTTSAVHSRERAQGDPVLPATLTPLISREVEVAAVSRALRGRRQRVRTAATRLVIMESGLMSPYGSRT